MNNTIGRTMPEIICDQFGIFKNMKPSDIGIVMRKVLYQSYAEQGLSPEAAKLQFKQDIKNDRCAGKLAVQISCFSQWYSKGKQIYRFDPALSECLLAQSSENLEIDGAIINSLPCDNFYVECLAEDFVGFFVIINSSTAHPQIGEHDVTICPVKKDGTVVLSEFYVADDKKISDTMYDGVMAENEYSPELAAEVKDLIKHLIDKIAPLWHFLIYLSAINAEIAPSTRYAVTNPKQHKRLKQAIKDGGVQVSHVGYRFGNTYRAQSERIVYHTDGKHKQGTPKTPHIRRSHFHSYWTGTGEDKKLIVKWINTIFVNGDSNDTVTVHRIE